LQTQPRLTASVIHERLVLEEEVGVREGRRFRNALKLSGLPHHKGLDTFDFAFQPDLDARKVRDLAALGFVEQ
jgi:DNA replication protein DnaC